MSTTSSAVRLGGTSGSSAPDCFAENGSGFSTRGPRVLSKAIDTLCVLGLKPADAGVRAAAVRDGERDDDLVGLWGVRHAELDRVEVRADHHGRLVVHGDVHGRALPAALLHARQD